MGEAGMEEDVPGVPALSESLARSNPIHVTDTVTGPQNQRGGERDALSIRFSALRTRDGPRTLLVLRGAGWQSPRGTSHHRPYLPTLQGVSPNLLAMERY
jgi:hypothetical protein